MKKFISLPLCFLLLIINNTVFAVGNEYFHDVGTAYNLCADKQIELYFDETINADSAALNIFSSQDACGNEKRIDISIKTEGRKVTVSPNSGWPEGETYIFVQEDICDINGNRLNKNLRYTLNVRRLATYDK